MPRLPVVPYEFQSIVAEEHRLTDEERVCAEDAAFILDAASLPTQEFREHVSDADVKLALVASTDEAIGRGVFGSPTFFVGDEMFFGKDRLGDVEAEWLLKAGDLPEKVQLA